MSNPNNCYTCDYKNMKGPDCTSEQHCYMFKDEPTEVCMQHTGHKEIEDAFRDLFREDGSLDLFAVATHAQRVSRNRHDNSSD